MSAFSDPVKGEPAVGGSVSGDPWYLITGKELQAIETEVAFLPEEREERVVAIIQEVRGRLA
jgi:hypothetical protein